VFRGCSLPFSRSRNIMTAMPAHTSEVPAPTPTTLLRYSQGYSLIWIFDDISSTPSIQNILQYCEQHKVLRSIAYYVNFYSVENINELC